MIIRSVAASPMTGLLLPKRGCAALTPLVIKASAGTLFKAPIYWCENLQEGLKSLIDNGALCAALSSHAKQDIYQQQAASRQVYVLGNESEGISASTAKQCQQRLKIPMANGVESLNVAVTAALIAFAPLSRAPEHQGSSD